MSFNSESYFACLNEALARPSGVLVGIVSLSILMITFLFDSETTTMSGLRVVTVTEVGIVDAGLSSKQ